MWRHAFWACLHCFCAVFSAASRLRRFASLRGGTTKQTRGSDKNIVIVSGLLRTSQRREAGEGAKPCNSCRIAFPSYFVSHRMCFVLSVALRLRRFASLRGGTTKQSRKSRYNKSYKSSQFGFIPSIKAIFAALEPPFICFSLSIASLMDTCSS